MWLAFLYILSFLLFISAVKIKFYDKKMEICFLSLVFIIFILIAAFRDYSSYPDFIGFYGYESRYDRFGRTDLVHIFKNLDELKDPGYYILGSLAYRVGINFRVWITLIAAFDLIAVLLHIKKYSYNYGLSFLMFLSLGYFFFMLCGLRQAIAIAFILFAYDAGKKHNLFLFCFFVFLAYLFHQSAIIFLPFYFFVAKKKIERKHIWILLTFIVITLLNYKRFMLLLAFQGFEDNPRYARFIDTNREGLNATNLIIYASMYAYCLITRRIASKAQQNGMLVNDVLLDSRKECFLLIPVGCFFRAFSMYSPEAFRLGIYFDILIISFFTDKTRGLYKGNITVENFVISLLFWVYFLMFSIRSFGLFA